MRRIGVLGLAALLLLLGLAVITGCGDDQPAADTTEGTQVTEAATGETSAGDGAAGFQPLDPRVEVNVAFDDAPGTAGIILADKFGFFDEVGIDIKYTKFNTGADMYTSLAADQVDVGRGIITASLFNGAARDIAVRVVADSGTNVEGAGNYFGLVLRKEIADEIQDYSDLEGRKILIVSRGSINELFLELALAKGGLTIDDVDATVIDSFSDLNIALANGAADAAVQIEPLITRGEQEDILVAFGDASEYAPDEQVAALLYSPSFAEKTEVAQAFMIAYLKGVRMYNDAIVMGDKDREEVVQVLSENTFVDDPELWTIMRPTGLNPNGEVNAEAVSRDQRFYVEKGLVEEPAAIEEVVDNSFAKFAVDYLGPYEPPAKGQ